MKVTDFSGDKCGTRYEKEYIDRFTDFLIFYIDGKLKFERYCHGEAACIVFDAWGTLSEDGEIIYKEPLSREVDPSALPKKITKIDGEIIYFDESNRKWTLKDHLKQDKANGYSSLKLSFIKLFKKS